MYNFILGLLLFSTFSTTMYQVVKAFSDEGKIDLQVGKIYSVTQTVIDPNTGYSSGTNEFCSSLGYWNDITAIRFQKCSNRNDYSVVFTGSGSADEMDPTKSYISLDGGNIRIYLSEDSANPKRFNLNIHTFYEDEEKNNRIANDTPEFLGYEKNLNIVNVEKHEIDLSGELEYDNKFTITMEL